MIVGWWMPTSSMRWVVEDLINTCYVHYVLLLLLSRPHPCTPCCPLQSDIADCTHVGRATAIVKDLVTLLRRTLPHYQPNSRYLGRGLAPASFGFGNHFPGETTPNQQLCGSFIISLIRLMTKYHGVRIINIIIIIVWVCSVSRCLLLLVFIIFLFTGLKNRL